MRPDEHRPLILANQTLQLLRFGSVQALPLPLEVEGLQPAGSFAAEMAPRSTSQSCVIEEGELFHGRRKIIRQAGWSRHGETNDLE